MNLEDALNNAGAQPAEEYAHYDAAQRRAQLEDLIARRDQSAGRQEPQTPGNAMPRNEAVPTGAIAAASGTWVEDWTIAAACRGMNPDELFVRGDAQNRAKTVCAACPVRTECLAHALDHRVEFGVWGGMTERERRALLRRRPDVRSWRKLLEGKREAYRSRQRAMADPAQNADPASPLHVVSEEPGTSTAEPAVARERAHPATAPIHPPRAVPAENPEAVKRLENETAMLLSGA